MDMNFSAPIHQDPLLIIHIVSEEWATETLPTDDVEVHPSIFPGVDEDEHGPTDEQENEEDKWNDLGLDNLAKLAAAGPGRPNGSPNTPSPSTPSPAHR